VGEVLRAGGGPDWRAGADLGIVEEERSRGGGKGRRRLFTARLSMMSSTLLSVRRAVQSAQRGAREQEEQGDKQTYREEEGGRIPGFSRAQQPLLNTIPHEIIIRAL
jgi:hypothetical protein